MSKRVRVCINHSHANEPDLVSVYAGALNLNTGRLDKRTRAHTFTQKQTHLHGHTHATHTCARTNTHTHTHKSNSHTHTHTRTLTLTLAQNMQLPERLHHV